MLGLTIDALVVIAARAGLYPLHIAARLVLLFRDSHIIISG